MITTVCPIQLIQTIIQVSLYVKKSNLCEEGGTHLRISVWHLLIYLKNNYLFEKLTDMIQ